MFDSDEAIGPLFARKPLMWTGPPIELCDSYIAGGCDSPQCSPTLAGDSLRPPSLPRSMLSPKLQPQERTSIRSEEGTTKHRDPPDHDSRTAYLLSVAGSPDAQP